MPVTVKLMRYVLPKPLLLWGEKDAMIPFANAAGYVKAMACITLVPFPGVGHLPQEEATARSLAAVRAFLE